MDSWFSCCSFRRGQPPERAVEAPTIKQNGLFGTKFADGTGWLGTGLFSDEEHDRDAEAAALSVNMEVDSMNAEFLRRAGPDAKMDPEEFEKFSEALNIDKSTGARLWALMDVDGNGVVDFEEFTGALKLMTQARAWLRYCTICDYDNSCHLCVKCADCPNCTGRMFCSRHWAERERELRRKCADCSKNEYCAKHKIKFAMPEAYLAADIDEIEMKADQGLVQGVVKGVGARVFGQSEDGAAAAKAADKGAGETPGK